MHAATDSATDEIPAFSRSAGLLSQSGNADAEVKTRLSFEAADDLRRLARECGMNVSEFVRVVLLIRLYGEEQVTRMTASQLSVVAGNGPKKALEAQ